jgi:hypothetical protein
MIQAGFLPAIGAVIVTTDRLTAKPAFIWSMVSIGAFGSPSFSIPSNPRATGPFGKLYHGRMGRLTIDGELQIENCKLKIANSGLRTPDSGLRTPDSWLLTLDLGLSIFDRGIA